MQNLAGCDPRRPRPDNAHPVHERDHAENAAPTMPPPESVTTLKPALICATDYRRPPRGIRRSAGHVHGHGGEDRGGHGGRCGTGEREPAGAQPARGRAQA